MRRADYNKEHAYSTVMAGAARVDFERITQVYREESGKKQLVELEPDFYDAANEYLKRLERETARASGENATAPKTQFLQDELRKARKRLEQIYQYRERKIALLAQSKVSGVETELKGIAVQEQVLFERLVAALGDSRRLVFGGSQVAEQRVEVPRAEEKQREPEAAGQPQKPISAPPPQTQRKTVTVYVMEDVPPFAGIDVTYKLMKEDVVSMPEEYANVLVKRGKARVVEVR